MGLLRAAVRRAGAASAAAPGETDPGLRASGLLPSAPARSIRPCLAALLSAGTEETSEATHTDLTPRAASLKGLAAPGCRSPYPGVSPQRFSHSTAKHRADIAHFSLLPQKCSFPPLRLNFHSFHQQNSDGNRSGLSRCLPQALLLQHLKLLHRPLEHPQHALFVVP